MKVRVCFIANANSPIAASWIASIALAGAEVHVISSYPADPAAARAESFHVVPVAFSGLRPAGVAAKTKGSRGFFRLRGSALSQALNGLRRWVGPIDVFRHVGRTRQILDEIKPDLVHAMRIPYEGLLASEALTDRSTPLVISTWGNDFTLHARRALPLAVLARRAMRRADALHADCERDARLAGKWGFASDKPSAVLPGNGGLDTTMFSPGSESALSLSRWHIPEGAPVVLNPRGVRNYVRNDTFFAAIPAVVAKIPTAHFVCVGMKGNEFAETWINRLGVQRSVTLLPEVPRTEMRDLFRASVVSVSPSEHDGTPNTLLEAMACGSFPVAGNIESLREWISTGENGLLCDPAAPNDLADAIVRALQEPELRERAARYNRTLIRDKADVQVVRQRAMKLYESALNGARMRLGTSPAR